jgi:hypothetical protein
MLRVISLGLKIRWQPRKNSEVAVTGNSLTERLDRYVGCIEQPEIAKTADERMAWRARLNSAFDRW